jgi:hypothetical protein
MCHTKEKLDKHKRKDEADLQDVSAVQCGWGPGEWAFRKGSRLYLRRKGLSSGMRYRMESL